MSNLARDLRASTVDGAFYSLMVGMGETYLAAFALALNVGEIATGLLVAVPMLAGGVLQLISPVLIHSVGSHRRWVVGCALCQSISLMSMPLAVYCGQYAIALLYLAATLYWGTGQATGPAWNAWIEELVPRELRARFFARRSHICQICVLTGFIGAGLFLEYGQQHGFALAAFSTVLVLAALCRLASAFCLTMQSDSSSTLATAETVGLRQIVRNLRENEGIKLCVYLFAVQVAVQIAGPYFSPFMLAHLEMSYAQYMLLVALGLVGKVLSLPLLGKLAHQWGPRALMWIGGAAITPLSGMWLALHWVEQPMVYLAVVQLVGGVAWAAYELAFFLMFFETIPRHERVSVLTLYNFGNALATVTGACIGAVALAMLGETSDSYLLLFGLSSICRVLALVFLARVPRMHIEVVVPAMRILSLSPSEDAGLDRPVLPSIPDKPSTRSRAPGEHHH